MTTSKAVSARVDAALHRQLRELVKRTGRDQSDVLRLALARGLRELRLETAVEDFQAERASIGRAAELAGTSVFEFLDELRRRRIPVTRYDAEDALEDVAAVGLWKS